MAVVWLFLWSLITFFLQSPILLMFCLVIGRPSLWQNAFVHSLSKCSNPSLLAHYRLIFCLALRFWCIWILCAQTITHSISYNFNLLSLSQWLRPGHGTPSAPLNVTGDVKAVMENTKLSLIVLIDFSHSLFQSWHPLPFIDFRWNTGMVFFLYSRTPTVC